MKTGRKVMIMVFTLGLLAAVLASSHGPGISAAQAEQPELVLFLAASSPTPFADLSGHHTVNQVASAAGGNVQVVYNADLGRDVFSFSDGGWLEVLDDLDRLTLTSTDEMTIEVGMKLLDGPLSYVCDTEPATVPLPITSPVPDQAVFSKGPSFGYPRNYAFVFTWARDNMRKEYCDPAGYFPGLSYGQGGMTWGAFSPMDPHQLEGWQVHAFRIAKDQLLDQMNVWVYKDGVGDDSPRQTPVNDFFGVDQQALPGPDGPYPLLIGNGYATSGTNEFNPNPFFGKIDYIRIYRGLLPVEELNVNPYGPIPDLPPPPAPSVVLSEAVCAADWGGRPAVRLTASAIDGLSNPLSAELTMVRITNNGGRVVHGRGVFAVEGPHLFVYPNGNGWTTEVTVTATDENGQTASETFTRAIPRCR